MWGTKRGEYNKKKKGEKTAAANVPGLCTEAGIVSENANS